jgi:hypothetical protein
MRLPSGCLRRGAFEVSQRLTEAVGREGWFTPAD